jgi:integrase
MASLYQRPRSPYYYISFFEDGRRRHVSTGLRADDPAARRRAKALCAKYTFAEKMAPPASAFDHSSSGWKWVPAFLKSISRSPRTLEAYELRWRNLTLYLGQQTLTHPRTVRHEHAQAYIEWRTAHRRPAGKHIAHNTATAEAKMLKTILKEARVRGLVERNALDSFRARIDPAAEKPEITSAEQVLIATGLQTRPVWMRRAWQISMATGCRLRETRLDLAKQVDLDRGTIFFPSPKGGRKKAYTIPLPQSLRPLFEELLQTRARFTLEFPPVPSKEWRFFFDSLQMPHLCFHCCRVTFITRLARANVPLSVAMRLVNHASQTIHRIYQRVNLDDLRAWSARLDDAVPAAPPPSPARAATPRNRRGRSTGRPSEIPLAS